MRHSLTSLFFYSILVALLLPLSVQGEESPPQSFLPLGKVPEGWSGFSADGTNSAALWKLPGSVSFIAPSGPQGWYQHGFRTENDSTINALPYAGVLIELDNTNASPLDLTVHLSIPPLAGRQEFVAETTAKVRVSGTGHQRLYLPWSVFDFQQATPAFLKFLQKVELTAKHADGGLGTITVSKVGLIRGEVVALSTEVRSHALANAGETNYPVMVFNCTDQPQSVALSMEHYGWEAMKAEVTPDHLDLAPGSSGTCMVSVKVPEAIPLGGQEKQTLRAVANGNSEAKLQFITARDVAHPYLLHTAQRWQEVRDKVKKYDWAKQEQEAIVKDAEAWTVPEMADPTKLHVTDGLGNYLFTSEKAHQCEGVAYAWELTHRKEFAEKVALFLKRVSDQKTGYPSTLRGCHQGLVHEGECFSAMAKAYDMILDADVLTPTDREQIDKTFRLLIGTMDVDAMTGGISNWGLDEYTGAMDCALMVGDLERAWRFYQGPNGILDQAGKGIMDDGWWFECSVNYNSGMAHAFSANAMTLQPWGINLKEMNIPAPFTKNYSLVPWAMQPGLYGMAFESWGPKTRSFRQIRDLWDGFLPFVDYRGIMFATNDSDEKEVSGGLFELAYYLFRDPKYAAMIKFSKKRDLLWGVPELPEKTPEFYRVSALADNAGIAVLRSQTPDRPQREQIQAVLKWGTHGGYHGHFDRLDLLSLMRYGRSFFHPEMAWYGYNAPLYKFWGQTSIDKNMVVVDRKMQEPVESKRLLFHTGPMLQAVAAETIARWSYPPFMGGMVLPKDSTWQEVIGKSPRFLPLPENLPSSQVITGYTEPILQRRLLAVTDDFVVMADYLKSDHEHTFDNLLQIKGFTALEAPEKNLLRHTAQMDPDPLNSAELITDCNWYQVKGPAVAKFHMEFGAPEDVSSGLGERNEKGPLNMDVYSPWPESREIMIGTIPESFPAFAKHIDYTVRVGDQVLTQGGFGAWVLGEGKVDVPVDGSDEIILQVNTQNEKNAKKTLFWGNPRLTLADGKEIPIPASAITLENTVSPAESGKDYYGGPIKIAGTPYNQVLPAEPANDQQPALVKINLKGLGATRFKAVVGADFPFGEEAPRRKTYSVRTTGKEAHFLTVIEPHEGKSLIQSVKASGPDKLIVTMKDGREEYLSITGLEETGSGETPSHPQLTLEEYKKGKLLRTETTEEK